MQEKKIKFTDVLFVGLAFFASYFGAGNLIFPPMLGLQSGSNWLSGMIGMLASGVGLPILAIIVLGMCGSVQKISDHVNKKFYTVMIGAIILCVIFIVVFQVIGDTASAKLDHRKTINGKGKKRKGKTSSSLPVVQ